MPYRNHFLLSILALCLLAIGVYFVQGIIPFFTKGSNPSHSNIITGKYWDYQDIDSKGWIKYIDVKRGLTFLYPPEWYVEETVEAFTDESYSDPLALYIFPPKEQQRPINEKGATGAIILYTKDQIVNYSTAHAQLTDSLNALLAKGDNVRKMEVWHNDYVISKELGAKGLLIHNSQAVYIGGYWCTVSRQDCGNLFKTILDSIEFTN